jgi:hypothetical protein
MQIWAKALDFCILFEDTKGFLVPLSPKGWILPFAVLYSGIIFEMLGNTLGVINNQ